MNKKFIFTVTLSTFSFTIFYFYFYNEKKDETTTLIENNIKFILLWNSPQLSQMLKEGNSAFLERNCIYTNCAITKYASTLNGVVNFDAVVFETKSLKNHDAPKNRSPNQKYIFATSNYEPLCNDKYNDFFNWTWTYRLDSDVRWGHITLYDLGGYVVGPDVNMYWPEQFENISDELKIKLQSKTKAVAWFVNIYDRGSSCDELASQTMYSLEAYGWKMDIFDNCSGTHSNLRDISKCYEMIERDYYFYFACENTFAEDYVTKNVLIALNNYAVPIVCGAADYSRFLPPNSYLNGYQLDPESLSYEMNEIMHNKTKYYNFFKWRNNYVYKDTLDEDICKLCEAMNNRKMLTRKTTWVDFVSWWNIQNEDSCMPNAK